MRILACLAACLTMLLPACSRDKHDLHQARPTIAWYASLGEAEVEAQETGDLVLLSFEASWCPWSRLMRESLYVSSAVVESLASFHCVRVDADRDTNLVREFGVTLYPTTVITDAYGREIGRMAGYHEPPRFLQRLARMRQHEDILAEMFRQEDASAGDPAFLIAFGNLLLEMGMYDGALIRFDRAARIDQDDRYGTLEEATYSIAEGYMLAGECKEAGRRFRLFADSYPASDRAEQACVLAALCYEKAGNRKVAIEIYEEYLQNHNNGEFSGAVRAKLDSLNTEGHNAG